MIRMNTLIHIIKLKGLGNLRKVWIQIYLLCYIIIKYKMDLDILIFIIRIISILLSFVWFYGAYYHMTNINGKKKCLKCLKFKVFKIKECWCTDGSPAAKKAEEVWIINRES